MLDFPLKKLFAIGVILTFLLSLGQFWLNRSATLGGAIIVHGGIPEDAVIEVYILDAPDGELEITQLSPDVLQYGTKVASIREPEATNTWSWEEARFSEHYEIVAALKSENVTIVAPQLVIANAGENALQHVIESPFQPDVLGARTRSVSISGTVQLNGPKKDKTSLLMLWRYPGETNYKVINRYFEPVNSGTDWTWPEAKAGTTYEILPMLQVDYQNDSTVSHPTTITAPGGNVNFTVDTNFSLANTNRKPVLEVCLDHDGTASTAIIRIPPIEDAGNYWVQVGSDLAQWGNTYNQKFTAVDNTQPQKVRVRIPDKKPHFVRYAYADCRYCQDPANFAAWSETVAFTCD